MKSMMTYYCWSFEIEGGSFSESQTEASDEAAQHTSSPGPSTLRSTPSSTYMYIYLVPARRIIEDTNVSAALDRTGTAGTLVRKTMHIVAWSPVMSAGQENNAMVQLLLGLIQAPLWIPLFAAVVWNYTIPWNYTILYKTMYTDKGDNP